MAKRLLPFRQYDEKDVINEFWNVSPTYSNGSTSPGLTNPSVHTGYDDGVVVVRRFRQDDTFWQDIGYFHPTSQALGGTAFKKHTSPIGRHGMFTAGRFVMPIYGKNNNKFTDYGPYMPIGITLKQTLIYDENGEPLLGRDKKLTELGAVYYGQACPIATAGIFTLHESAFYDPGLPKATINDVKPGDLLIPFGEVNSPYTDRSKEGCLCNWSRVERSGLYGSSFIKAVVFGYTFIVGTVLAVGTRQDDDAFPGLYYVVKLDFNLKQKNGW
jgi:hypothetical protein